MQWLIRKGWSRRPAKFDGAGQAIAEELHPLFQQSVAHQRKREQEQTQTDEWVSALRQGLFEVVRGFNVACPEEYQLALLDRGDRMVLHAGARKTLTLIYGENCVVIESRGEYPQLSTPMSLKIWRDPRGELQFRAVPDSPVFPAPVMTQAQFLSSVVRMACDRSFERGAEC